MTHRYIDVKLTEDRDIEFDGIQDLVTVDGFKAIGQNIAISTFDESDRLVGSTVTATKIERLRGRIKQALREHPFVETVHDVSITSIEDESIDVEVRVNTDEEFHFTV